MFPSVLPLAQPSHPFKCHSSVISYGQKVFSEASVLTHSTSLNKYLPGHTSASAIRTQALQDEQPSLISYPLVFVWVHQRFFEHLLDTHRSQRLKIK